jgi:hypothetical protein
VARNTYTLEGARWRKLLVGETIEGKDALVMPLYGSSPATGVDGWKWYVTRGGEGVEPTLEEARASAVRALAAAQARGRRG